MKTKSSSQSPPTPCQSRKRRKVMSVESDVDDDQAVFIECRRSVVDVRQMLNQWKYFRHNENFTGIPLSNLTIYSFEKTHCNSALTLFQNSFSFPFSHPLYLFFHIFHVNFNLFLLLSLSYSLPP